MSKGHAFHGQAEVFRLGVEDLVAREAAARRSSTASGACRASAARAESLVSLFVAGPHRWIRVCESVHGCRRAPQQNSMTAR